MPAAASAAGLPSRLGKYELLLPLAAGGMARIYIGRSTGIGHFERHVVLKMITPERANDLTAVNMFLDEARLAASLNHQNVAQVFEVGEDGGIHYLAMEYVHGQDMRAVLAKAGSEGTRIPLELSLTVVAGAAAGLHHAHERRGPDGTPLGIVHRDVSPSNIMIGYDGAVKLLDFGIAKATQRSVETQSGIIKGKFAYMSPEQCRGRDVDRRSDVFSLGIILYEVSTQHRCFRTDSDFDTMHRIVTGDVVRPTRLVQGYPQALEAIVMKALATDPAQRYQSAGLLLEALESFAVSSRMSLSTMGLGRFMRDMFGEVQEPWLGTNHGMQSLPAKENTISSTGGASSELHARQQQKTTPIEQLVDGVIEKEGRFENSAGIEAAKTMHEMPSDAEQVQSAGPDWSAKSYPPPQAAAAEAYVHSGSHRLPSPGELAPRPTPPPQLAHAPHGTQPPLLDSAGQSPSSNQFSTSGSGSAPAHPAIVATKHGYASAAHTRGDVSYPRYTAPHDALAVDVQLRPNRRPLFIGIGIIVAGVIVMLVVAFGGSRDPEPASGPSPDEPEGKYDNGSAVDTPNTPEPRVVADESVDDSMVSIVIHSDPPGADVMIAGGKIGVTPLETKLRRGTKVHPLTVRKDGYVDFAGKIDLGGEYENTNIKLARVEDAKANAIKPAGDGTASGDASGGPSGTTGTTGGKPGGASGNTTSTSGGTTGGSSGGKTGGKTGGATTTPNTSGTIAGGKQGGGKTGGGATGGGTQKPPPPKCQPPGPNVDPFGPPICKS